MLSFVFGILIFNTFFKTTTVASIPENADDKVSNVAVSFVKEWLRFDKDELDLVHKTRLAPFVSAELLANNVGLSFGDKHLPQSVVNTWLVSSVKLDATHYTVTVGAQLRSDNTTRNTGVAVPVAKDEDTGQYYVYEKPSFSPLTSPTSIPGLDLGSATDVKDSSQLRITLTNFFQKYIEADNVAELANFLTETSKGKIVPKGKIVEFVRVDKVNTFVLGTSSDGTRQWYNALVTISTKEPITNTTIESDYILMIEEQDNKYLVEKIAP